MDQIKLLPRGLWPVMLTPFLENYHLDLKGLRRLTDFYLSSGVNGLFSNCLSSEMFQLNEEERLTIIKTVVDQCQNKVPVIATGSFTSNTNTSADFIKKVYDQGVAAVIVISSVVAGIHEDDDVLKTRLEHILNDTGQIPLGIYECPLPYKRLISPEMMNWLAATGRFFYHKDTSCSNENIKEKLSALKNSHFSLFNADTPTALQSLQDGARGISPISANYYPELYTYFLNKFYEQGITGDLNNLNRQLIIMDKINHCFYPYAAKWFLQKRGLKISTTTRTSYEAMTAADKIRLEAVYVHFQQLTHQYEIELKL
ncbi:dihydrodipicolinate synthase family protein [soil metagenome]